MADQANPSVSDPEAGPVDDTATEPRDSEYIPSQADITIVPPTSGGSPADQMITMPTYLGEWLTRSNFDPEERADLIGMLAQDEAIEKGEVNWDEKIWVFATCKVNEGGKARDQFLAALGAVSRDPNKRTWFNFGRDRMNRAVEGQAAVQNAQEEQATR